MSGLRLEVIVYMVTISFNAIHNAVQCINSLNSKVENYALSALCSAYSVLTEEEKKLGVILIELGAGTSNIIAYNNSSVYHISSFDEGGEQITLDISKNFRCSINESERIKIKYGCAMTEMVSNSEEIDIQLLGAAPQQKIKRIDLCGIIEKKMEALFLKIKERIEKNKIREYGICGIALTGGVSEMKGVQELCEKIIDIPARIGAPYKITGYSEHLKKNRYSAAVGLLNYVYENDDLRNKYEQPTLWEAARKKLKEMIGQLI